MKDYSAITAIIAITILEAIALFNGVNGTYFALVLAAIAGLGGYQLRNARFTQDLKKLLEDKK